MSTAIDLVTLPDGLKKQGISAIIWGASGSVLRICLQFAGQIILARILGPEPFGIFAVGIVIVFFSTIFADAGLAYGLIQRPTVNEDDIRFVFTWQMLSALLVTLILFSAAPLIAAVYSDRRLTNVLRVLSSLVLINASGAVASMLCRRELDFKTPAIASIIGYAAGFFLVGIPMALGGFGVYALVTAFLVQALSVSVLTCAHVRHSMRPLFRHDDVRGIFTFGATVFTTRIAVWMISSLDRTIIGATLGLTAAGLYATMNNLIYAPTINVVGLVQSVLYSTTAKLQGSLGHLRLGYRTMLTGVALFLMPVFVGIAAVPQTLVSAALGRDWIVGASLIPPLALTMIAVLLIASSTPVLWTSGQTRKELQLELPAGLILAVAIYLASRSGSLTLIAWVACLVAYLRAVVMVWATLRSIGLKVGELPGLVGPGVAASAFVGLVAIAADHIFAPHIESAQLLLAIDICFCALALATSITALRHRLPPDFKPLALRTRQSESRLAAGCLRQ
jgi:lipopolysaccharide exporter